MRERKRKETGERQLEIKAERGRRRDKDKKNFAREEGGEREMKKEKQIKKL